MSGLPTVLAAEHLFDALRALNRKPRDTKLAAVDTKLVDSLERRLKTALQRDRAGTNAPDGYPTLTAGGGTGSRSPSGSSTETAAIALADSTTQGIEARDRHHELTVRAAGALEDVVVALNTLVAALASIDDLTRTTVTAKTCAHCTTKRGAGNDRPVAHRGTVGDRLERALDLCDACWGFVRQSAGPNTRAGYLPSDAQIRDHEERGRWRIHVA